MRLQFCPTLRLAWVCAWVCALICAWAGAGSATAHDHDEMSDQPAPGKLGVVSFETSCKPQVRASFNRAVALLHSFWHNEAERTFQSVALADPDCAMAYWGEAMTHFHQFLDTPTRADLDVGGQALSKAEAAREKTPRETTYIHALRLFYDGYTGDSYVAHAKRYSDEMAKLVATYPRDVEGKIFYALSLLSSDGPEDLGLVNPRKAVAMLYPLFKQAPDHPGIAHYIIHACDNPEMAQQGLAAARRYALIAPAAPHALHMPAHIFARLGLWPDDIRSNLASKAAAQSSTTPVGAENRLHPMEFLEYAYLQQGHDEEALGILREAKTIQQSDVDPRYPDYYATVEARFLEIFAVETHDWTMAAQLPPISGANVFSQELTLLAHAIAAGHQRDVEAAKEAAAAVDLLQPTRDETHTAWNATRDEIHAWADFSQGDLDGAVRLLRPQADLQARVGKQEVDLPAREMLAEMLLMSGKAADALREYRASLHSDPNRFNALYGAGKAAEALGRHAVAVRYYRALLHNCRGASGDALADLAHAREVVGASGKNPVSVHNQAKAMSPSS